jgi:hypothetical protein
MALRTYQRGVSNRNVVDDVNADACTGTVMTEFVPTVFDEIASVAPAFGPPVMWML